MYFIKLSQLYQQSFMALCRCFPCFGDHNPVSFQSNFTIANLVVAQWW